MERQGASWRELFREWNPFNSVATLSGGSDSRPLPWKLTYVAVRRVRLTRKLALRIWCWVWGQN